jgi:purine-binding chemotaxis protein CheW
VENENQDVERILRERARDLAHGQIAVEDATQRNEALVVRVGQARYAVPLVGLAGVVSLDAVTPLPGAPPFVAGLAHLHGQVLTIVDLGVVLGEAPERPKAALLVEVKGGSFGFGVSGFENVVSIPATDLAAAPPGLSDAAARYVLGVLGRPAAGLLKLSAVVKDLMQGESGDELT